MRHLLRANLVACLLAGSVAAQSALQPGDVAAITTAGLWLIRPPTTTEQLLLPAASFGGLVNPAVEWRPGTDEFIVCSGDRLWSVHVLSVNPASVTITNITPAASTGATYIDLDIHAADGRLMLVDANQPAAMRYAPPFAAGMGPDLVVPLVGSPRAVAVDSYDWPPRILVGYGSTVRRHDLDGTIKVYANTGVTALDQDRQEYAITVSARENQDSLFALSGVPGVAIEFNMLASLCGPVVLRPDDVEFDTHTNRAIIFAEDGLNPACMSGYSGGNHVVTMPLAQAPQVPPIVLTGPVSTIAGEDGDLALVWTDQAFVAPYGSALGTAKLKLAPIHDPYLGDPGFGLAISAAPAGVPVLLLAGLDAADFGLAGGQAVLVAAPLLLVGGVTAADGTLDVLAPIDAGLPSGFDVRVQAIAFGAPLLASNGLVLHIGAY